MRLEAEDNINILSTLCMTKSEADLSGSQWKGHCATFLLKMLLPCVCSDSRSCMKALARGPSLCPQRQTKLTHVLLRL